MASTSGCLVPWKGCSIPAPRAPDNTLLPSKLEFIVRGPYGDEDRPYHGGTYELAGPGGYKLSHGTIRPFPQATQPPIMLVRCWDTRLSPLLASVWHLLLMIETCLCVHRCNMAVRVLPLPVYSTSH
jgi:hypothetical protein